MNTATAHCPFCDPACPELDSDGFPYDCYVCCNTGSVPKALADAYWQEQEDNATYKYLRPVINGKHVVLRCDEECSWEEREPLLPRSIFPKPVRSRANRATEAAEAQEIMEFDDLPF